MANLLIVALLFPLWRPFTVDAKGVMAPDSPSGNRRPLMRAQDEAMQLGAKGEFAEVKKNKNIMDYDCDSYILGAAYVLGAADHCQDAPSTPHTSVNGLTDCEEAARQAGTTFGNLGQPIQYDDEDKYPKGCYRDPSGEFFFNDADTPAGPITDGAVQVCRRDRFVNGSADGVTCPDGYERLKHNETCKMVAECLSRGGQPNAFIVGTDAHPGARGSRDPEGQYNNVNQDTRPSWAWDYNSMPAACFIREQDGMVYFNEPMNLTTWQERPAPTAPIGMPLCVTTVRWN